MFNMFKPFLNEKMKSKVRDVNVVIGIKQEIRQFSSMGRSRRGRGEGIPPLDKSKLSSKKLQK